MPPLANSEEGWCHCPKQQTTRPSLQLQSGGRSGQTPGVAHLAIPRTAATRYGWRRRLTNCLPQSPNSFSSRPPSTDRDRDGLLDAIVSQLHLRWTIDDNTLTVTAAPAAGITP